MRSIILYSSWNAMGPPVVSASSTHESGWMVAQILCDQVRSHCLTQASGSGCRLAVSVSTSRSITCSDWGDEFGKRKHPLGLDGIRDKVPMNFFLCPNQLMPSIEP